MFQYGVVTLVSQRWRFTTSRGVLREAPNFYLLLDHIGAQGWEAVAAGNFGGSPAPEILMKKVARRSTEAIFKGKKGTTVAGGDAPFPAPRVKKRRAR